MLQKRLILVLGVLLIASMVLGACGPAPTPVTIPKATMKNTDWWGGADTVKIDHFNCSGLVCIVRLW